MMNNKQRAYLSGLASKMTPILQIGKSSLTPEIITAVDEALEARTDQDIRAQELF